MNKKLGLTNIDFCKEYVKSENVLISTNCAKKQKLIIATRKKSKGAKANKYLLLVLEETQKRIYISSLYPVVKANNTSYFRFEHTGRYFELALNFGLNTANIKAL